MKAPDWNAGTEKAIGELEIKAGERMGNLGMGGGNQDGCRDPDWDGGDQCRPGGELGPPAPPPCPTARSLLTVMVMGALCFRTLPVSVCTWQL